MPHQRSNSSLYGLFFAATLCWGLLPTLTIYVLTPLGADHLHNYPVMLLCAAICIGIIARHFRIELGSLGQSLSTSEITAGLVAALSFLAIGPIINIYFPLTAAKVSTIEATGFYYPLLSFGPGTTKLADVLYQQIVVYGVVQKLKFLEMPKPRIIWVFTSWFFLAHLPLTLSMGWFAFYFILPSVLAGLFFAYVILYMRRGSLISFATHLAFYLVIGLYLRIF